MTVTTKWLASLSKNGIVENIHKFIRSAIEFATTIVRFWVTTC